LGTTGSRGAFAGDLSLTILCCLDPVFEAPKTKGIGQLLSVDLMPPPKSNEGGVWYELFENKELESPMSLSRCFGESGALDPRVLWGVKAPLVSAVSL
jgi:hypothetical protein